MKILQLSSGVYTNLRQTPADNRLKINGVRSDEYFIRFCKEKKISPSNNTRRYSCGVCCFQYRIDLYFRFPLSIQTFCEQVRTRKPDDDCYPSAWLPRPTFASHFFFPPKRFVPYLPTTYYDASSCAVRSFYR